AKARFPRLRMRPLGACPYRSRAHRDAQPRAQRPYHCDLGPVRQYVYLQALIETRTSYATRPRDSRGARAIWHMAQKPENDKVIGVSSMTARPGQAKC